MLIQPTGGLCNRLRVLFSYNIEADRISEKLRVLWVPNSTCNGSFLDYFEPLDNVEFISNTNEKPIYVGCATFPNLKPDYKYLKPKSKIIKEIQKRVEQLDNGDYISAHIRRTDLTEGVISINKYISDDEFINFFNKSNKKIFLATDNQETQSKFKNIFKDRLIIFNEIQKSNNLRMTSLKEAIIDLYLCILSKEFYPTSYSSFSDLITELRKTNII